LLLQACLVCKLALTFFIFKDKPPTFILSIFSLWVQIPIQRVINLTKHNLYWFYLCKHLIFNVHFWFGHYEFFSNEFLPKLVKRGCPKNIFPYASFPKNWGGGISEDEAGLHTFCQSGCSGGQNWHSILYRLERKEMWLVSEGKSKRYF